MDTVVLVLGDRNGGGLDWRGSDKRHQAEEGKEEELHGSGVSVVDDVVVCDIMLKWLIVEKGRGER